MFVAVPALADLLDHQIVIWSMSLLSSCCALVAGVLGAATAVGSALD